MAEQFIQGKHWLEPIMPSPGFPPQLLVMAEKLPFQAGRLTGLLPAQTAKRVGALLRITSSYYSNLIEGQFTEPANLAPKVSRRPTKELRELAVTHILAQEALERGLISASESDLPWSSMFSVKLLSRVHGRLFKGASSEDIILSNGRLMVPGQLRDAAQQNVMVGDHAAPAWESVTPMITRLQDVYGAIPDQRTRLLGCLAYHHRLAFVHPFEDGNGRLVRMITHLQLLRMGLASPLWSLSRGLARQQDEYYGRLRAADQARRGDRDGRGQLSQAALIEFVEFMLQVCIDQMSYVEDAMGLATLRARLERIVAFEPRFSAAGVKQEMARALYLLITQGEVLRADFKVYTGLGERTAIDQLKAVLNLGVVEAPGPKSRQLYPGLPVWFAQLLFPDLHRRFG
jgi:Fic family protein